MNRKTKTFTAAGIIALGITAAGVFATAANADTTTAATTAPAVTPHSTTKPPAAATKPRAAATKQTVAPAVAKYGEPGRETLGLAPADDPANVPFDRCNSEQAGSASASTDSGSMTRAASPAEAAKADRIEQYCAPLIPKPAWELDRTNPDSLAFADRVVAHLRAAGVPDVKVSLEDGSDRVGFAFGGTPDDSKSIQLGLELLPKAELAAAGR